MKIKHSYTSSIPDSGDATLVQPSNWNDVHTFDVAMTAGSIVFFDGTEFQQDNSNLFWDKVSIRLGIRTNTPTYPFEVNATGESVGVGVTHLDASNASAFYATTSGAIANNVRVFAADLNTSGSVSNYITNSGTGKVVQLLQTNSSNSSADVMYQLVTEGTKSWVIGIDNAGTATVDNDALKIGINASLLQSDNVMTLLRTGEVGIGTQTPTSGTLLEVNGKGLFNDNLTIATGSLYLPTTTATYGIIFSGIERFAHAYGTDNAFIGVDSGNFTLTGASVSNSGFGHLSLSSLTSGAYNTAIGCHAMQNTTTGGYNTALGRDSLFTNADGSRNIAIGFQPMYLNVSGNYNIAIGYQAQYNSVAATTILGSTNLSLGNVALYDNLTGVGNVAVGDYALNASLGNNNTAIGRGAGALVTGSGNVFLGYMAGTRQTGSNFLIIDNQDRSSIANEITNSLVYGTFNATPASQTIRFNATGTIPYQWTWTGGGIDVTGGSVHLNDNISLAFGNTVASPDSTITFNTTQLEFGGTDVYFNGPKLGIGTTPTYPLDVSSQNSGGALFSIRNFIDITGSTTTSATQAMSARVQATGTQSDINAVSGLSLAANFRSTSAGTSLFSQLIAIDGVIRAHSQNARTFTSDGTGIIGIRADIGFEGGTVNSDIFGVYVSPVTIGGTVSVTGTDHIGFYIGDLTGTVSNYTFTNHSGLWIDGITSATNNYGIVLNGDITAGSSTDLGGAAVFGAGKDSSIGDDGTDLVIDTDVQTAGSRTINLVSQSSSAITTETLSEYVIFKIGGVSKKFAIVA